MAELVSLQSTKMMGKLVDAYWEELRNAPKMGRKVAWTCGPPSSQLMLASQGIAYHYAEPFGAYVAGRKMQAPFLNACHDMGYSPELCSYEKVSFGHIKLSQTGEIKKVDPKYDLPRPDFTFTARCCPNHASFADTVARIYNIPSIKVDVPIQCVTKSDFAECKAYVKRQLQEVLIPFVENMTGHKYDYDKLSEMTAILKKTVEFRAYFMEMGKLKPAPLTFFDAAMSIGTVVSLAGRPEAITYSEQLKAELDQRVAKKVGAITEEKHRLYYDQIPIWYKLGYMARKLATHGANIVVAHYTHGEGFPRYPQDFRPEEPVDSMADFLVRNNQCAVPSFKLDFVLNACKEYEVDGAIFHNNRTCRYFALDQFETQQNLERKLGIPTVNIDGDAADPQFCSDAQLEARLDAFLEMLESKEKIK